ncbi:hypothetical protein F5880DRAFT_1508178 [Lentinula raphanica]|nr:hypothetical protein F5880DRAFT_1508178 [Lentinula raphanica]
MILPEGDESLSLLLALQLSVDETRHIADSSSGRRGRERTPMTDEAYALKLHEEENSAFVEDFQHQSHSTHHNLESSRKGKAREGTFITDEDYALALQHEEENPVLVNDSSFRAHSTRHTPLSRKGKARERAPMTDEEYALKPYEENRDFVENSRLGAHPSTSYADNVGKTKALNVSVEEWRVNNDYNYALLLADGQTLPEKMDAQKALETQPPYGNGRTGRNAVASNNSWLPNVGGSKPIQYVIFSPLQDPYQSFPTSELNVSVARIASNVLQTHSKLLASITTVPIASGVLPPDLRTKFRSKAREYGTLASDRVYCATPTCSEFLGSSKHLDRNAPCRLCSTSTCTLCKQRSHPHENCNHAALTSLRALARERQWQTCPGCGSIIELRDGCNHVTCRCHMEFCYVCAAPWKTCACPQWNREDEADVEDEEEIEEWREAVIPPRRIDDVWGPRAHAPVIPDVWGPRAEAPVIPPMWIDEGVRHGLAVKRASCQGLIKLALPINGSIGINSLNGVGASCVDITALSSTGTVDIVISSQWFAKGVHESILEV